MSSRLSSPIAISWMTSVIRLMCEAILVRYGYQPISTASGEETLKLFAQQPDLHVDIAHRVAPVLAPALLDLAPRSGQPPDHPCLGIRAC